MALRLTKSLVNGMVVLIMLSIVSACGGPGTATPANTSAPTTAPATVPATVPVTVAATSTTTKTATRIATRAATSAATQALSASAICSKTVVAALDAIKDRCAALGSNQVCYGNTQIDATLANSVSFKAPGDIVHIADLKTLHTQNYNQQAGTWGIAVLRAAVDLPGTTAGQQVTFLMYGDTTLDSVSDNMQTVYFHTGVGQQQCQELPPSGLMVQVPRGQHVKFSANGADVTLGSTALLQAVPNQQFTVSVLEGQGTVSARGVTQTVNQGYQTQVALTGTTASAPPAPPRPIPIQAVSAAPANILPQPITSAQIQQAISVATAQAVAAAPSITPALTWTPGPTLPPVSGAQQRIAFVSNRDGKHDIYLMNADGSNVQRLTNTSTDAASPAWSPDGRRIAFSLFNGQTRQIYAVNSDASSLAALTPATANADHPAWSPDGKQIAYDSLTNGNRDIWLMNADGSNAHAIASDPAEDEQPAWSPDGKQIAFTSLRQGTRQIFVMDADGNNVKRLTNDSSSDAEPAWSPDGKSVAFSSAQSGHSGIYVANADGTNLKQIAPSIADESSPMFSPDGKSIAFVSNRDGAQAIYLLNLTGTDAPRAITPLSSDNTSPSWQR